MFLVLAGISFLFISGCGEESFSRYPSVAIPEFANEDYYVQLSDKNPQVTYNAVVNLGEQAAGLGKLLSDDKANKNSPEYITADKIYHRIVKLLNSSDSNTVAASLRFLQLFSSNYSKKPELLNPALKIKSDDPQVLYEQIRLLERIPCKSDSIGDSILRKFVSNPSWVVSRSSYLLIDKLGNENLRQELISRYKTCANEAEKLLILTAFNNQPGDIDADFFFGEIMSAKSNKIRYALYDILGNCKNQEKVLTWVAQNYGKILTDDRKYLFQHYAATMEDNFSTRLLEIFLNNGFIADRSFLKLLDEGLEGYSNKNNLEPKDEESLSNLKKLEGALINGKAMVVYWQNLRKEKEVLNARITALQSEYNTVIEKYSVTIDEILKKYGVSEKMRKEYLENITISRESLKALFEPDKESKGQK